MPDKRLLDNWLAGYLDLTSNLEAKESLHRWTGLVCISAAIQRKLYIEMEHGIIFPNLYVFIVAESAAARKSTAMNFGKRLMMDAFPDLQIFGDDVTPQGLVKALNHRALRNKNGHPVEEQLSDFFIISDELADLFGWDKARAAKMVILLTRTYMCPEVYNHITARDSWEKIYNLYPVVLGATDPRNLNVLPESAVGGLTGRLIWVIEKDKRHVNPGWKHNSTADARRQALREYLIHDIQRISRLEGEYSAKPEAKDLYDNWYRELSKRNSRDRETDAFYNRCHTTAIQLAILLSVSCSDSRVIELAHMRQAIAWVEDNLPELKRVTTWTGPSQYEQNRAKMLSYLQASPGGLAKQATLLKHMGMSLEEFKKLCETLVADETIEQPRALGGTRDIRIKLTALGFIWKPEEKEK